jgi:hypothetical protein
MLMTDQQAREGGVNRLLVWKAHGSTLLRERRSLQHLECSTSVIYTCIDV